MQNHAKIFAKKKSTAFVLAVVLILAGCTAADRKNEGRAEKVTIAFAASPDSALVQVAQLQGYYQREGLNVVLQKYTYGKMALQSVLDGKADFATVAETPIMFSIMNGADISIVATILSSNRNAAIIANGEKGIRSPSDLRGKRVGCTFGTISEFFMDVFLTSHGIARKEVKVIGLSPEEMEAALENGRVDAVSAFTPFASLILKKLGSRATPFYDEDIYTQTFNVVAKKEFVSKKPETVRKLLRSLVKAEEFTRKHTIEAQNAVADMSGLDKGLVDQLWTVENFDVTLDQSLILALEDESRWAVRNKLVTGTKVPNYLNAIYFDGLTSVEPKAVRIIR